MSGDASFPERRRAQAVRAEAVRAEAVRAEADAEAERARKAEASKAAERAAAEARRRIAVVAAEAATADAWARLTPRQIKARRVARLIVAAGGNADNVDVVSLNDIDKAVGAARTTAGSCARRRRSCWRGGYDR